MFGMGILRAKIHSVQFRWQSKTPKEKWDILFETGRISSEVLGIRIYSDVKTGWYTLIGAIVITSCIALITYTIQFYCVRNEFVRSIECSCPLGIIIPVSKFNLI